MYTATMVYSVKTDSIPEFVRTWNEKILKLAVKQPGFVRMLLITREGEAMAMGTWEDKESAERFMALGPFKNLMRTVKNCLTADPIPKIWTLEAFAGV